MDESEELQNFICSFLRLFKKLPEFVTESNKLQVIEDYGVVYRKPYEKYEGAILTAIKSLPELSKFNNTFWESFNSVATKTQEEIYTHAVLHYFSTYGLESLNIDNKGFIYLPFHVKKDAPELDKFFFIDTLPDDDVVDQVLNILNMNTGLNMDTIEDCYTIIQWYGYDLNIREIYNKEVRAYLSIKCKYYPETVEEAVSIFNYLFQKTTCFVKNQETINYWKNWEYCTTVEDRKYITVAIERLDDEFVQSWYRYKDYILQLKGISDELTTIINRISRRAKKEHIPYKKTYLTTRLLNQPLSTDSKNELKNLSTFQLVKIYNKLAYYQDSPKGSADYFAIRNGKFFIKENSVKNETYAENAKAYIKRLLKERYSGYILRLPKNIELAFPDSEKRFIGDIPFNSIATFDDASVIGISWKNQGQRRVDLDLSLIDDLGRKFGWNGWYRDAADFIYSGDMTTEGAESFFINAQHRALLYVNAYNVQNSSFDFFIANESHNAWKQNKHDVVDLNKCIFTSQLSVFQESIIGIYVPNKFIFTGLTGQTRAVAQASRIVFQNLKVFEDKAKSCLKLRDIFETTDQLYEEYEEDRPGISFDQYLKETEGINNVEIVDLSEQNKSEILKLINNTI